VGTDRATPAKSATHAQGRAAAHSGSGLPDRHHLRAQEWHPLGDAASGVGLWVRHDLLASAARLAAGGYLGATAPGVVGRIGTRQCDRLGTSLCRQRSHPGQKGGPATGPDPTNRGKPGTKRHLVSDQRGTPLVWRLTGANRNDSIVFEELIDAIPPIMRPSGQRRKRPDKLHGDKAYDIPRCRQFLRRRGIRVRIARKGVESSQTLGRHRWVIERTLSWLNQFRRLTIRYERRDDIHEAFLALGCCLICLRAVERFC
jgi:transposase